MRVAFLIGISAAISASNVQAKEFDWRDAATREQIAGAFENTARACAGGFGFTLIPPLPRETMVDKLHAYLLLRDDAEADAQVVAWGEQILKPVNAMLAKKGAEEDAEDDHRAAAAAVAAAEDPSTYNEAEARYMEGAMAPIHRGLDACTNGARDPFLGKYYWTGAGKADDYEKDLRAYFDKLVAELRKPKRTTPRKR